MTEATQADIQRAQAQQQRNSRRVMASGNPGNDGQTTFLDYGDLRPQNEVAAFVSGAAGSGLLGGMGGFALGILRDDLKDVNYTTNRSSAPIAFAVGAGLLSAAVGGIVNMMRARTHNDWAREMMDKERNRDAAQSGFER